MDKDEMINYGRELAERGSVVLVSAVKITDYDSLKAYTIWLEDRVKELEEMMSGEVDSEIADTHPPLP